MSPRREAADYADLLHLQPPKAPHPMSRLNRAAQFAPFAALVGYGDMIDETARLTQERLPRSEEDEAALSEAVNRLSSLPAPRVAVTYFRPDERKSGGSYLLTEGILKRIDSIERMLYLRDGTGIPLDDVYELVQVPSPTENEI